MTRHHVKRLLLRLLHEWNSNIIWQVTYQTVTGSSTTKWFKDEGMAREWASLLHNPRIEAIKFNAASQLKFSATDDQVHIVQHSL